MMQYYKGCKEKVSGHASDLIHSTPVVNPLYVKYPPTAAAAATKAAIPMAGRASLMVSNIGTPFPNAFWAVANSTFCRAKFRNSRTWSAACWKNADTGCWIIGIDIITILSPHLCLSKEFEFV